MRLIQAMFCSTQCSVPGLSDASSNWGTACFSCMGLPQPATQMMYFLATCDFRSRHPSCRRVLCTPPQLLPLKAECHKCNKTEFKQQNGRCMWIQNVLKIQNHFVRAAVVNENTNSKFSESLAELEFNTLLAGRLDVRRFANFDFSYFSIFSTSQIRKFGAFSMTVVSRYVFLNVDSILWH